MTLPGKPILIDSGPVRLGQRLINLLDNARKHTDDTTEVSVHLRVRDGHAELCVSDTGPSFDPAPAATLFDPFTRPRRGPVRRSPSASS